MTKQPVSAASSKIPPLPPNEQETLLALLHTFTTRHQSHHRPTVLVTSGGTATDLEANAVRFLDNFSTGRRGAISVEEFLKRGYAVIHLWRKGSAAPYTRALNGLLSPNGAGQLDFEALGRLFEGQEDGVDDDEGDVHRNENNDPWLTSTANIPSSASEKDDEKERVDIHDDDEDNSASYSKDGGDTKLSRRILNSTILRCKLRERSHVLKQGLLLTVPFRTVEEYLAKLQLCSESIKDCRSLGMVYLAAAVSDFYIPMEERSEHKIQSQDYGIGEGNDKDKSIVQMKSNGEGLTIHLRSVPKCISHLRENWAPDAFCVSFKLETDKTILYDKAKMAMDRYGVHMVIGNLLSTRHEKVWVLQKREEEDEYLNKENTASNKIQSITRTTTKNGEDSLVEMVELTKGTNGINALGTGSSDELEDSIISHVVERHFSYIATNYPMNNANVNRSLENVDKNSLGTTATIHPIMSGAEAAARHNLQLQKKKQKLQKELYWTAIKDIGLQFVGNAVGMVLTYILSSSLQKRMR